MELFDHPKKLGRLFLRNSLVWNVEEKKSFIESMIRGYPVPLFLFAEIKYKSSDSLEIIDGMQRLNAITAFIEQEYDIEGEYFDLETMASSKILKDGNQLRQKLPAMDRKICAELASYLLPFSIYRKNKSEEIDEVFRRINSGGRQLSRQDIRQSGSTAHFANIVRKIACKMRGDDSAYDKLLLNDMKKISISNFDLDYGINAENIFWVKESILPKEKVRGSRDEEVIADILAYILLKDKPYSNKAMLDTYYGIYSSKINEERFNELEENILKISPEIIVDQFLYIYEELKKTIKHSSKQFNKLMFKAAGTSVPRYFQSIFLAMYELLINNEKVINNYQFLATKLDGIGSHINVGTGAGGVWTATGRTNSVNAVIGIIQDSFKDRGPGDPALNSWTTELENILMQSYTEQSLYDFKQGCHVLHGEGIFDQKAFSEYVKTMTAIANQEPNITGYLILGIADSKKDAEYIKKFYSIDYKTYNSFCITGIDSEAKKYHKNLDQYFSFILSRLKKEPVSKSFIVQVTKDVRLINYNSKSLIIFKIKAAESPILYGEDYYERLGPNTEKVDKGEYPELFGRFYKK